MLNPTAIKQLLPWRTKTIQIVGISNKPQQFLSMNLPIPFCLGPQRDTHSFLLSSSAAIHLLSQDLLEKHHIEISFSQKREINPEFDSSHQISQSGELNNPWTTFICSISDGTIVKFGSTNHLSLLVQLPSSLQAKPSIYIGRIHSVPPFKIQIYPLKPLPRINQYPTSKESLQGIKPIIEDYKTQDLIVPCTSAAILLFYL